MSDQGLSDLGAPRGRAGHAWVAGLATLAIALGGCAQAAASLTPAVPGSGATSPGRTASASTPATSPSAVQTLGASAAPTTAPRSTLLVLGGANDGAMGLWTYALDSGWKQIEAHVPATAIGRDASAVLLASRASIESRALNSPAQSGTAQPLGWWSGAPTAPVEGVSRSGGGRCALVVSDANATTYAMADKDGTVAALSVKPVMPFSPLVAWLDQERLVVLSSDGQQTSRLAVIETSAATLTLLKGLSGARVFAVSPDGSTVAAASESAVHVGPVGEWLANKLPPAMLRLGGSQVVWDLALDANGTHLAMLSGQVGADGTVTGVRELAYESSGAGWAKIIDVAVPFQRAAGQVWLG